MGAAQAGPSPTGPAQGGKGELASRVGGYLENHPRSLEDLYHSSWSVAAKQPPEEGGGLEKKHDGEQEGSRSLTCTISKREKLSRSLSRLAVPSSKLVRREVCRWRR
jgi:hypothetical protein